MIPQTKAHAPLIPSDAHKADLDFQTLLLTPDGQCVLAEPTDPALAGIPRHTLPTLREALTVGVAKRVADARARRKAEASARDAQGSLPCDEPGPDALGRALERLAQRPELYLPVGGVPHVHDLLHTRETGILLKAPAATVEGILHFEERWGVRL